MHMISVDHEDGSSYRVTVEDADGRSIHLVTVMPSDVEHYAPGATPEELLEASFEFLLQREPRAAILASFDLPVIERDFPDYPQAMRSLG